MKKYILILLTLFLIGCSSELWNKVEVGADKINKISNVGSTINDVTSNFTGQYGEVARLGFIGLSNLSLAIVALAKHRKAKNAIKTAVESAEKTSGGGKALVQTAIENGLINEIKSTYTKLKGKI
jgi:hypothetical protein